MIRAIAVLIIAASVAPTVVRAAEDGETSGLLKLTGDRKAAEQLNSAAERISRNEFAAAEEILVDAWQRFGAKLAESAQELQPVSRLIRNQIERLPEERQTQFWGRVEPSQAGDSSAAAFDLPTRAGYLAWRSAAIRHRDRGEFEFAISAWRQAAVHPSATETESAVAILHAIELQAHNPSENRLSHLQESLTDRMRQRSVQIGGQITTIGAWLQQLPAAREDVTRPIHRPALTPRWSRKLLSPDVIEKGWRQAADELREQGLIRLPAVKPCVIGPRIVARTPEGLICLDAETGNVQWQLARKGARDRLNLAGQPANPFFSGKLLSALAQASQANTLAGDLSHDGQTVYQVVETGTPAEPAAIGNRYGIEAVDVVTGQILWRAGVTKSAAGNEVRHAHWTPNGEADDFSVCGAPLVLDGRLFLLSNQNGDLIFQCINSESLDVEWALTLGHLFPDAARTSPQKFTAAKIVWTGGALACLTNCGVVAAVDPVQRQLRWINRYPMDVHAATRPEPNGNDPIEASVLHAWRDAMLVHSNGVLVAISPDSPQLHVIQETTGRIVARIPRGGGRTLLGISDEIVVILESTAVRVVRLRDGQSLWRTILGEVRGRGMLTKDRVVQPLADGSVAVLDLQSGRVMPGPVHSTIAWGDLIPCPGGWVSGDEFQMQSFADVGQGKTDGVEPVGFPEMLLEADFARLRHDPSSSAAIRERWQNRELKADDRGELLWRMAQAAKNQKRWTDVVDCCLAGLSLDLPGERTIFDETTRRVRWDRAFQGEIAAALRAATDEERLHLKAILAAKWETAKNSDEPFGLQQLEHRWRMIPGTRSAALDAGDAIFLGVGLFGRDLWLRATTNVGQEDIHLPSAWRLREEWNQAGFDRDARDIDISLLRRLPGAVVDAGETLRQRLNASEAELAESIRRLNFGSPEIWSGAMPQITPKNVAADDALQTPIPIHADAGGVWDRMDVAVDRQARTLRFSGGGERGAWSVALPKGPSPLQQYPLTYQGWGLGRWMIVRIGTLLFAVSPWNEQGEPDARLVWSLDLIGPSLASQESLIVERQISTWKRAHEAFRILDPYGRDVACVGPVRAGYLCYLRRGKLIAVDTQTGQQLWERWDVPPDTIPLGDEDRVVLWTPELKRAEVLDAADGRTLTSHACDFARDDIWHTSGCRVWSGNQTEQVAIFCHDLATDERRWTREFPAQSLPTELDEATGAVLDPRGVVHLIDLETGTTRDEPLTVELPNAVERVIVSSDEHRWYLGVSGAVARSFDWISHQPLNGFRRPLLQGPLIAIDKSQRQIVWRRDVLGEPWALDQPRSAPVLMQSFKQPPPAGGPAIGEGVIRLIDQRTGRDVFTHRDLNLLPYASFEPFPEFQKFELKLNNATFDVDYAAAKKKPE